MKDATLVNFVCVLGISTTHINWDNQFVDFSLVPPTQAITTCGSWLNEFSLNMNTKQTLWK